MAVPTFPSTSEAKHDEGFLNSRDHLRLYWQRYLPPEPRATVAVVHGHFDHSGRYAGITTALVRTGCEVALLDYRGHGQSDGRRWHVDAFSDYLMDLDAFMDEVRNGAEGRRIFVVAHSQGGQIAALWGLEPGRGVAGFVLSSPYLRLALKPPAIKLIAGKIAGKFIPFLPFSSGLRSDQLTSDEEMQRWTEHDPLHGSAGGTRTTPRWFDESNSAQEEVLRRAGEFAYPLLVLVGTDDPIADHRAGRAFLEAAGSKDKELKVYEGFRHELFNEVGRERPIADTVAWISHRTGGETH
jgi:alpha-beta hydrolase superfamily lysophospholipase